MRREGSPWQGLDVVFFRELFDNLTSARMLVLELLVVLLGGRQLAPLQLEGEERVGLGARLSHRPAQLSGGERQRAAVARALVTRPALVLADEPTGNLDTHTSDAIFALMRQFNREHGTAFLVVTHDPRLAARCERIIELVDGRIASDRANVVAS